MNKYFLTILIFVLALSIVAPKVSALESTFEISTSVTGSPISPVTPSTPVSSSSSSGSRMLLIENLSVASTHDSGIVSFTTTRPTQAKIFWGLTGNYESGSISGIFYGFDHLIKISTLDSDTKYYFRIEVTDSLGISTSVESSFQTEKDYSIKTFANVTHFLATPQQNDILLSWNIPINKDIQSVRLIKSDKFFPRDPNDGEMIYEGNTRQYLDKDVFKDKTYYYAIFAKDSNGNFSSGVLAQARISTIGEPQVTDPFIGISILENVDSIIGSLKLLDFDFIQDGKKIEHSELVVPIDGTKNLTILLDYNKVPEILKTIAFTLSDPDDATKVFTFLLRVDKDKKLYEATIAPLGKSGKYKMNIVVLDYKNQGLKRLNGQLQALVLSASQDFFGNCGVFNEFGECSDLSNKTKTCIYLILLLLLIIILTRFILKKRKDRREKQKLENSI